MTSRLRLAAQAVADLADSRHPWADAKTWWDAVVALRSALAQDDDPPTDAPKVDACEYCKGTGLCPTCAPFHPGFTCHECHGTGRGGA
jgi:DnaJ-class molecular chaperone